MKSLADQIKDLQLPPDISKYITFIQQGNETNGPSLTLPSGSIDSIYQMQISKLTSFYNFNLVAKPVKRKRVTPYYNMLSNKPHFLYHQLLFLEDKIFRIQKKKHTQSLKTVAKIIEILQKNKPSDVHLLLYIDDATLFSDILEESSKVKKLHKLYKSTYAKLQQLLPKQLSIEDASSRLANIIRQQSKLVDTSSFFTPYSSIQSTFEELIMAENFPFADSISKAIDSFYVSNGELFCNLVIELESSILDFLNISLPNAESAVTFLLYRFLFAELYPTNRYFIEAPENINNRPLWKLFTIEQLMLPLEFCPECDVKKYPVEVFYFDPFYRVAISKFEEVLFYSNPFDIIGIISDTVTEIEKCASHYDKNNTLIFPFEVTFGLFLAVVFSSCVSNLQKLAEFVDTYTPHSGLSPSFDYARAKLVAASAHIEDLIGEPHDTPQE